MSESSLEMNDDTMDDDVKAETNIASFPTGTDGDTNVTGKRLQSYLERIERLEEEKSALGEDIKDIYGEAKGFGFDTKTMRKIIRLRKMEIEKRREEDELLELYKAAIGME